MNANVAFTIVAKNYIGLAQILEKSLKKNNPDTDFFIVVADDFSDNYNKNTLPSNIIIARKDLNIPVQQWMDMSFKYNLTEFCTSIKPASFSYFIENTEYTKIIYLDPDIYVFNSFEPVYKMLDNHSIVLTPHINTIRDVFLGDRSESGLMSTGVFNLGFCGIKKSNASRKMISWWHQRLLENCYIDSYDSYFTDQKWMDFLPCYFNSDDLYISRHLGMNIAPWNFFERKIFFNNDILHVCDRLDNNENKGVPVIFVHYSGYNYNEMKERRIVQNNITDITDYHDIKVLTQIYSNEIKINSKIFDKYIKQKYSFGTFENGVEIQSFHRRIYRSLSNKGKKFEYPFSIDKNSLYQLMDKKGMIKISNTNIDKVTKFNLQGVEKKIKIFNKISRIVYKLLGFNKYILLIRLMRSFGRFESQIHLISSEFDEENIK